jgi:hypothetical protein
MDDSENLLVSAAIGGCIADRSGDIVMIYPYREVSLLQNVAQNTNFPI